MALTYAVTTVPHLLAYLQRSADDLLLLEQLIDGATIAFEKYCKKPLVTRAFTEKHTGGPNGKRGGSKELFLDHRPIVSVTSIQDDQSTPATVPSADYQVLAEEGILEHHAHWPAPIYHWNVAFTAGHFTTTEAVDENVRLAAHVQIDHWLSGPERAGLESIDRGDETRTFRHDSMNTMVSSRSLLPEVQALLAGYRGHGV